MNPPDLSSPIFKAMVGDATIASGLALYDGLPAVFTRRPVPADAPYPMAIAAGDIVHGDEDLLTTPVPVIVRDIAIYGQQPDQYRAVETLSLAVRGLFHRRRNSLVVPGWNVIDIVASGPIIGPTDDANLVARIVTLRIRLTPAA